MSDEVLTLYIGVHSGHSGEQPKFQKEVKEELKMSKQRAQKFVRALHEIAKYLKVGSTVALAVLMFSSPVLAGGGDWIDTRQQQQQVQLEKAYQRVSSAPKSNSNSVETSIERAEIKTDGIDQAYVWIRTFTPSWVVGVIFLAGLTSLLPWFLRKFGINVRLYVEKKGTKKDA